MTIEDNRLSVNQDQTKGRSRAGKPKSVTERDGMWRCELCGKFYPVPVLARECEDKHLSE